MAQEIYIVGTARTAIGTFGGALKDVPLADLAHTTVAAALDRSRADVDAVGHVVMGNVIPTDPKDAYLSRVAALKAGVPTSTPAFNVNRLCGSGLQAIISAAQTIGHAGCELSIAGGAESMSRSPFISTSMRWGQRMGEAKMIDYMLSALQDPIHDIHMGITAENVAARHGITREEQDALAVESHRRAARAIAEGRFAEQIVPVAVKTRKGVTEFTVDEHVRAETSIESISGRPPAFLKDGTVTAANASGLNDGAAAVILASDKAVKEQGLTPMARLVTYAHAGVDPEYMGLGPVPASRKALSLAGLSINDIDVIESNEAFAAQACAVAKELGFDPEKVNPNGSGISLGHPIGATGAIITVKALHELQRVGGRYALVTMCIGGGQGIAAIFERV